MINLEDPSYFLGAGRFTDIDSDTVERLSLKVIEKAEQKQVTYLASLCEYFNLRGLNSVKDDAEKQKLRRTRTASQIITSRISTGCCDIGLVFVSVARRLGIPSRYVETLENSWLEKPDPHFIRGHIFADVFIDGKWQPYEPYKGFCPEGRYLNHTPIGRGLDFSELYLIKPNGEYETNPTNLDSSELRRFVDQICNKKRIISLSA